MKLLGSQSQMLILVVLKYVLESRRFFHINISVKKIFSCECNKTWCI